jgi:hypothetical protein
MPIRDGNTYRQIFSTANPEDFMLPYIPSSETWLSGAKRYYGLTEDHPKVARILEILRKKEAGEITLYS